MPQKYVYVDKSQTFVHNFFPKLNINVHYILAYMIVERPQELNNSYGIKKIQKKKILNLSHFRVS